MTTRTQRLKQLARRHRAAARRQRRGVLLLIVLSLLVMFMLVGTAFVLVGSRYVDAEKAQQKSNVAATQPGDLLQRAIRQIIRDTHNQHSAARYHSLLRDAYGTDGFVAKTLPNSGVTGVSFTNIANALAPRYAGATTTDPIGPTVGQFIDLYLMDRTWSPSQSLVANSDFVTELETDDQGLPVDKTLSQVDGYYEGCVLTFLNGPARGQSTRIVQHQHLGNQPDAAVPFNTTFAHRLRVVAVPNNDGTPLALNPDPTGDNDLVNVEFMVNGRPFNGSGVGLNTLSNPAGARLTAYEAVRGPANEHTSSTSSTFLGAPIALMPNPRFYLPVFTYPDGTKEYNLMQVNETTDTYVSYLTSNGFDSFAGSTPGQPLYQQFPGPGGSDESYDAPDYQNMFLASSPLQPRARGRVIFSFGGDGGTGGPFSPAAPGPGETVSEIAAYYPNNSPQSAPQRLDLDGLPIPSFHRPALVNYWLHKLAAAPWLMAAVSDSEERVKAILQPYGPDHIPSSGDEATGVTPAVAAQIVAFKRKYTLRPLLEDHPNFTGSNAAIAQMQQLIANNSDFIRGSTITFPTQEVTGPWDVDNDGDGIPDSIWVDLGMPVQETEDGRLYKPLFAILVQDLDGKLNLNAHGTIEQTVQERGDSAPFLGMQKDFYTLNPGSTAISPTRANLTHGVHFGPTDFTILRSSDQLPHGSGFGPGDASLRSILSPQWASVARNLVGDRVYDDSARLLGGRAEPTAAAADSVRTPVVWGRYGPVSTLYNRVNASSGVAKIAPGKPFDWLRVSSDAAGAFGTLDPLANIENFGAPHFDPAVANWLANVSAYNLPMNQVFGTRSPSGFGTMPDLKSAFAIGLDYSGAAIHESAYEIRNRASGSKVVHFVPNAPTPLLADSPYELNLMDHTRRDFVPDLEAVNAAYSSGAPIDDDAPFSPGELERLLRAYDADAGRLPDRLWMLVDAFDPDKLVVQFKQAADIAAGTNPPLATNDYTPSPSELLVAQIEASTRRRAVTTESFDIPSTNEDWTARLLYGADGLPGDPKLDLDSDEIVDAEDQGDDDGDGVFDNLAELNLGSIAGGCDDYAVVMQEPPPAQARLVDYLRYRIVLELKRQNATAYPAAMPASHPNLTLAVNNILHGRNDLPSNQVRLLPYSFGGLLAPEVIAGRKMDLNRPFGDGKDNNGNGVVDEPAEAGEAWIDNDNDGVWENDVFQESDGDSGFYADRDDDGDTDVNDWIDLDGDGVTSPRTDHLWQRELGVPFPFDHANGQDANGRGAFTPTRERIRDDAQMARQLYARHLYCLALLLVDENYLMPYDANDPQVVDYLDPDAAPDDLFQRDGSPAWHIAQDLGGGNPQPLDKANAVRIARRKLTCRRIAQWAINCADMRDPDAIMTPFEYDENPWDGWNVVDTANNQYYPLDGDPGTDENLGQFVEITSSGWTRQDQTDVPATRQTRGLVWGMERPELLITETFAFHDRRVEDLAFEDPAIESQAQDENGNPISNQNHAFGDPITPEMEDEGHRPDTTMDQRLRPEGAAFVELYNPWSPDGQLPAELYAGRDLDQPFITNRDPNEIDTPLGVDLAKLSVVGIEKDGETRYSPVWRMIAVEEHPRLRNDDTTDDNGRFAGAAYNTMLPKQWEDFTEINKPRMLELATNRVIDPENNRARVPDPDFPTFDQDAQPRYINRLNSEITIERTSDGPNPPFPAQIQRFRLQTPRQYVERAFYFTSDDDGLRDPVNLKVRIPLGRVKIPMQVVPGAWSQVLSNRAYQQDNLWPDGISVVNDVITDDDDNVIGNRDYLEIFNHHFVPSLKELIQADNTENSEDLEFDIPVAPVLPGRYCVVGTAGFNYNLDQNSGARKYLGRFITPIGRRTSAVGSDNDRNQPITGEARDTDTQHGTRRIELIPWPDPNVHQVLVDDNAGNESFLIDAQGNDGTHDENITFIFPVTVVDYLTDGDRKLVNTRTPATALDAEYRIKPAVAIPVRGMSLSAPVDNYLLRWMELEPGSGAGQRGMARSWEPNHAYGEGQYSSAADDARPGTPAPFDEPFDLYRELVKNHTTPNYRTVHLQRLANPLLPWNPLPGEEFYDPSVPVNPYRTIDGASADVTAFNGVDPAEQTLADPPGQRQDFGQPDQANAGATNMEYPAKLHEWSAPLPETTGMNIADQRKVWMTLSSGQRGLHAFNAFLGDPTTASPARLLWQQEPVNLIQTEFETMRLHGRATATGNDMRSSHNLSTELLPRQHVLDYPVFHSLGFMNQPVLRNQLVPFNVGEAVQQPPAPNFYTQSSGDGATSFNAIDANGDGIQGDLIGTPFTNLANDGDRDDDTYAALFWGNRPYASALEIMQVPATSSGLLTREFSTFNPNLGAVTFPYQPVPERQSNPYNGAIDSTYVDTTGTSIEAAGNANLGRFRNERGQFGHLLNLFNSAIGPATLQPITDNQLVAVEASGAANLSRLGGYLGVPSRFVATHLTLNPNVFNTALTAGNPTDARNDLLAPFNTVDKYREPGRVNLNTVVGLSTSTQHWSPIYDGLMHRYFDDNLRDSTGQLVQVGHRGPAWRDVVISRRGYLDPAGPDARFAGSQMDLHPSVPTFFGNPFREAEESMLVPLATLTRANAEATLLRSHPFTPGGDGAWGSAASDDNQRDIPANGLRDDANEAGAGDDDDLFESGLPENYVHDLGSGNFVEKTRVPLFSAGTTEPAINSHRNAALRYMPMTRMSSMTTTRSGVFAIWITVGFFEVTPAPDWNLGSTQTRFNNNRELYERVYPDGYQLGKELGSETGDTHRHRGFWIVDRTLPVGFRPGEDVNVDKMILLNRRIE